METRTCMRSHCRNKNETHLSYCKVFWSVESSHVRNHGELDLYFFRAFLLVFSFFFLHRDILPHETQKKSHKKARAKVHPNFAPSLRWESSHLSRSCPVSLDVCLAVGSKFMFCYLLEKSSSRNGWEIANVPTSKQQRGTRAMRKTPAS